jgi:hypothetical protein
MAPDIFSFRRKVGCKVGIRVVDLYIRLDRQ